MLIVSAPWRHPFFTLCLSVCHSLLDVWRVAPREGWPAHTDGLSRIAVLLLFSVGDGSPCRPFRIVLSPALRVGVVLPIDVSDVLSLFSSFTYRTHTDTLGRKAKKR
ncbi:trans-sialidase [Trypanosoma cruzi]|nr:trans-sialidase [Trypanosoma cruzi]